MRAEARRIRIDLAYDGTDFAGWQVQRAQRTVQGELERTLIELQGGEPVSVCGAGRTDAGVHASHQVADCRILSRLDDRTLAHALRCMLPPDVRPRTVTTMPAEFHARRDARSKTYSYRLDTSRHGDPFAARYALHEPRALDLVLVRRALELLPGRRDWSGFTASACDKVDRVRTLYEAQLERPAPERLHFVFRADGFLHHMVRNLVGTLLEVGAGTMAVNSIAEILAHGDRGLAAPTAAARGLFLTRVSYAPEPTEAGPLLWGPGDGLG